MGANIQQFNQNAKKKIIFHPFRIRGRLQRLRKRDARVPNSTFSFWVGITNPDFAPGWDSSFVR